MDNRKLNRLVDLLDKQDELNAQLKAISVDINELQSYALENMQNSGQQSIQVKNRTLYINRQIWASIPAENKDAAIEALNHAGLDWMVKPFVNAQTLSGWVREFDPDGLKSSDEITAELPETLRNLVNIAEVFKLGVRKASARKIK